MSMHGNRICKIIVFQDSHYFSMFFMGYINCFWDVSHSYSFRFFSFSPHNLGFANFVKFFKINFFIFYVLKIIFSFIGKKKNFSPN